MDRSYLSGVLPGQDSKLTKEVINSTNPLNDLCKQDKDQLQFSAPITILFLECYFQNPKFHFLICSRFNICALKRGRVSPHRLAARIVFVGVGPAYCFIFNGRLFFNHSPYSLMGNRYILTGWTATSKLW